MLNARRRETGAIAGVELNRTPQPDIPFSRSYVAGNELKYLTRLIQGGNISSDGAYTKACAELLSRSFGIHKVLLVPSATAALEMAVVLAGVQPGDEVIVPSFTFTSTANAVLRAGAKPVFVEIRPDTLNLDETQIERHITPRTRAILPVHYAGVSCEMEAILAIAQRHGLKVIEDAAQAVNSFYGTAACGSIGHLGAYSFHSTKDYTCGEGGALCINSPELAERAEILRDKGTNRSRFLRGEVDKYTWIDAGSSYVPSELTSAYLLAQLESMERIKMLRRQVFARYAELLRPLEEDGLLELPSIPLNCSPNFHLFYILLKDQNQRDGLMAHLAQDGIRAHFHFVPLHSSPMGRKLGYQRGDLPLSEALSGRLLRLPYFPDLTGEQQRRVRDSIRTFLTCGFQGPRRMPPRSPALMSESVAG